MTRIIPKDINKKLQHEYRIRFYSLFLLLISLVIFITLSLVASSYVLLYLYEKAYAVQSVDEKNKEAVQIREEFHSKLNDVYLLSNTLPTASSTPHIDIVSEIYVQAENLVFIRSIEIGDISQPSSITVRGISSTRENLVTFKNNMKQNSVFKDFDIPVEILAQQKDISFNVTFTYAQN